MIFIKLSVNTLDFSGRSSLADLNEVLSKGGIIKVKGCTVFVDNPENLNYYTSATGYYVVSAQGWKVYFKCRDRAKAQAIANEIFGKGVYTIQSKL